MKKKIPLIGVNMDFSPDVSGGDARRDRYFVLTQYLDSIYEAGGLPVSIPCMKYGKFPKNLIDMLDGFLFVGGADYPPESYGEKKSSEFVQPMGKRRYDNDLMLASLVIREEDFPILGICGGAQLMNIVAGGKLIQDIKSNVVHTGGSVHKVRIIGGKILKDIFGEGEIEVNSFHHQAVAPRHVGKGLDVTALSRDGIIEAIESKSERFMLGVQWHPERMESSHRNGIFKAFVKACRSRQPLKIRMWRVAEDF